MAGKEANTTFGEAYSSSNSSSSNSTSSKPYQATVEDVPESSIEDISPNDVNGRLPEDNLRSDINSHQDPAPSQADTKRPPSALRTGSLRTGKPPSSPSGPTDQTPSTSRIRHENLHVHFSNRQPPQTYSSPPNTGPAEDENARPRQNSSRPRSQQSQVKLSPVDLKWGLLFSKDGLPTERLDQLLGGIAEHLISELEPNNSSVISPEKLQMFYRAYPSKTELIHFPTLFSCNSSYDHATLEDLYSGLHCEYYLVPKTPSSTPTVPALTVLGFIRWKTCCILADPEQEAFRLNSIVKDLPIETRHLSGVISPKSGAAERLPKQLSRHLLPAKSNERVKRLMLELCDAGTVPIKAASPERISSAETPTPLPNPSKRGRDECRDDASRRYKPQSRLEKVDRDPSRSRSRSLSRHRHRAVDGHAPERVHRRVAQSYQGPERAYRYHREVSPRPLRRSSTLSRNITSTEGHHYHDHRYLKDAEVNLRRAPSGRSMQLDSSRNDELCRREQSPGRYSRYRRSSYQSGSSESLPKNSPYGSGDARGKYDRNRLEDIERDGRRGSRRR